MGEAIHELIRNEEGDEAKALAGAFFIAEFMSVMIQANTRRK